MTVTESIVRSGKAEVRGIKPFAPSLFFGLLVTCLAFSLYVQSLVPSILSGDPAQFQYVPAVLGIPYPPGFPLYVLLGHLWTWLPIGTLAYRMNLFSALFGALTVGVLFVALRRQNVQLLAALASAFALAILPPFWQYATFAAEYTLHAFLLVLLITLLSEWEKTRSPRWLQVAALAVGFGLSNHPTFFLLLPATIVFVVLVARRDLREHPRLYLAAILLATLPLGMYLYIPFRGQQIIATTTPVLPDWQSVVAQGIVSPFYKQTPSGLLEYFTAQSFVKNIGAQWKWDTLLSDWSSTILHAVDLPILISALAGIIMSARKRQNLLMWSLFALVTFSVVAFQYVYTALSNISDWEPYFAKFFLPGFIFIIVYAAWGIDAIQHAIRSLLLSAQARPSIASTLSALVILALMLATVNDLLSRHSDELIGQSNALEAKWRMVQLFPPEPGAALMGHWGDLTPLWYFQNAEAWRRDVIAIFPPTDNQANSWIAAGKPLYLAGALLGWAPDIAKDHRLTPWGALVRVTLKSDIPQSPLSHSTVVTFGDKSPLLRLLAYDLSSDQLRSGEATNVALYWQTLAELPVEEYVVGLSLDNSIDEPFTQSFPLTVSWLPDGRLVVDQRALGVYKFTIPLALRQGTYRLRVAIYSILAGKNLMGTPEAALEIGTLRIVNGSGLAR